MCKLKIFHLIIVDSNYVWDKNFLIQIALKCKETRELCTTRFLCIHYLLYTRGADKKMIFSL